MSAEDGDREPFGPVGLKDVLNYRRAAIAVVSAYVGLEDGFVDAVLADRMDEWLLAQEPARERLKTERYDEYLSLLARETVVRYAASAAESLASDPDSAAPPPPSLRHSDDLNAIARVHEALEFLESPDSDTEADRHLAQAKLHLCRYYAASAAHLVRGPLFSTILTAAEELCRRGSLSAARVRELVIAGESA